MENPIVNKDFLLHGNAARILYHDYAAKMPIIDYHCHLPPKDIALNRKFDNLSQLWLEGDHYKWRAMRTNGVNEKYITGNTTDWEKFNKWAETVPYTMRNPLYHWTHLELKNPFGITNILNGNSAKAIYDLTSEMLASEGFCTKGIIRKFNVQKICTTEDPTDSLEWHRQLAEDDFGTKVSTSWRPDLAMAVGNSQGFNQYIERLEEVTNRSIKSYTDYTEALKLRHDYFHENGCRIADHGLEFPFPVEEYTENEISGIFSEIRSGKKITPIKQQKFMSAMLYEFAIWNFEKGWVQQYHIGALRDVNIKGVRKIGKACGFDSIADFNYAASLGEFLNRLEEKNKLTKTIIYNLNPKDNEMVASMIGNFQDG
ncbi:MAG: glucuronate isomerase, partial [Deltaproteobacteria bacterium]|nr:glucuronate isomerase [Deltaproteobacteria bacterium]